MPPKGKGQGKSKSKADDAPKSSPKKKTGTSKSPRKPKPIPEDSSAESSSSTPKKKKTASSKSPNKRKKNTEDSAESRVSENEPIYDLLNPSPSRNEYLEHAMFFKEPKIEEPEIPDVPPLLPPGFEEPPRSFGGLEEIVESAKQLNTRKD